MKLKELFTIGNGIFEKWFKPENPTEYAKIFGDIDPRKLDVYTLLNYGEKEVFPTLNQTNVSDIVSAVIAINVLQWVKQAEAYQTQYDLLNPVQSERSVTETKDSNETGNGTNTDANKAFNESDFSDSAKETISDTSTRSESVTRKETITGLGNKNVTDELRKEIEFRRTNYRKNIIFAVVSELTLQIYE